VLVYQDASQSYPGEITGSLRVSYRDAEVPFRVILKGSGFNIVIPDQGSGSFGLLCFLFALLG